MDTPLQGETSYHDYTKASTLYDQYRHPWGLSELIGLLKFKQTPLPLVADLGCGTGNHLIALEGLYQRGIGVDINEAMLGQFQEKIKKQGLEEKVELKLGSCLELPLPSQSCDGAIMTQVLHHLGSEQNRQKAFHEAYRVLKPKGIFIINHTFDQQTAALWPSNFIPTAKTKVMEINGSLEDLLRFGAIAGFSFERLETVCQSQQKLQIFFQSPEGSSSFFSLLSPEQKEELKSTLEELQKQKKTLLDLNVDWKTSSAIGDSAHLLFVKQ